MTKDQVVQAIWRLTHARSEEDTAAALAHANGIVPHACISDLVFYGERDRTHDEIAEEALLRERIWSERGEAALRAHIEAQMQEVLADTSILETDYRKVSAETVIKGVRG